jgi:hypothetical protein
MIKQRHVAEIAFGYPPGVFCLFDGMYRDGIGNGLDQSRIISRNQDLEAGTSKVSASTCHPVQAILTIGPNSRLFPPSRFDQTVR